MEVSTWRHDNMLHLRIEDEGKGFGPEEVAERSSGIRGMQDRAFVLGGSLEVKSALGEGTSITALLPLKRRSSGRKG